MPRQSSALAGPAAADPGRFQHLPERIRPEDMIETHDVDAVPDPTMGRDPDRDFMLRNAG